MRIGSKLMTTGEPASKSANRMYWHCSRGSWMTFMSVDAVGLLIPDTIAEIRSRATEARPAASSVTGAAEDGRTSEAVDSEEKTVSGE